MSRRYTIKHYQMHLKEYSIGSHLCTNIVMLGIFVFKNIMRLYFCISNGNRQGLYCYINSYTSFSIFILPLLNET